MARCDWLKALDASFENFKEIVKWIQEVFCVKLVHHPLQMRNRVPIAFQ